MVILCKVITALTLLSSLAAIHPRMRPSLTSQPDNVDLLEAQGIKGGSVFKSSRTPKLLSRYPFIKVHGDEIIPYINQTQKAKDSFAWIAHELRHFIKKMHFEAKLFEESSASLQTVIEGLEESAKPVLIDNTVLSQQLRFVKSMFHTMRSSAITLNNLRVVQNRETQFISDIIDTNIRVWGLFNGHGKLDKTVPGYVQKVFAFTSEVICWRKEFKFFRKSGQMQMEKTFKKLIEEIEEKVDDLLSQLSHGQFRNAFTAVRCEWEDPDI